jgi:hypothetical protein
MAPQKRMVDLSDAIESVKRAVAAENAVRQGRTAVSAYLRECLDTGRRVNHELVRERVEQMETLIADLLKPRDHGDA